MRCLGYLHPKQREFVESGDIGLAGRGGGKSFGAAVKFHQPWALYPGCYSVFVTSSSERSRDILMPSISILSKKLGVPIREYVGGRAAIWPNGYRVLFRGAKDKNECNKRRGTPWVRAGWDEGDSINPHLLHYDIHECVEPRLVDHNGSWFATGTPGAIPEGYWYDMTSGGNKALNIVTWDARDNPHLPNAVEYFFKALRRMCGIHPSEGLLEGLVRTRCKGIVPPGLTHEVQFFEPKYQHLLPPAFLREYLGLWVKDESAICYPLTPRNSFAGNPPWKPTLTTIGLDLGGASQENPNLDHCAWTVAQSATLSPDIYIRESSKDADMTPTSLAIKALQLVERYDSDAVVYIDSAGAGKLIEQQFRRMGLSVRPAIKGPKKPRIQLVQHAMAMGELKLSFHKTETLRNEMAILVWNDRHTDHHPRLPDDGCDSMLYAVVPHLSEYQQEENEVVPGSKEALEAEEQKEYDRAFEDACEEIDGSGF